MISLGELAFLLIVAGIAIEALSLPAGQSRFVSGTRMAALIIGLVMIVLGLGFAVIASRNGTAKSKRIVEAAEVPSYRLSRDGESSYTLVVPTYLCGKSIDGYTVVESFAKLEAACENKLLVVELECASDLVLRPTAIRRKGYVRVEETLRSEERWTFKPGDLLDSYGKQVEFSRVRRATATSHDHASEPVDVQFRTGCY